MPAISPYTTHDVAMGPQTGGGVVSIMGSTPAAMSGAAANAVAWYSASKIIVQDYTAGAVLKTYDTGTLAYAQIDAAGGNRVGGGASVWAAQLGNVRTSVGGLGPFAAYFGDVSELGQIAVVTFVAPAGVKVYTSTGTLQRTIATLLTLNQVFLRQNIISYLDSHGWHLVNVVSGTTVPGFQPRASVSLMIPFTLTGTSTVGVLERDGVTGQLSVRAATQMSGLLIPTVGTEFGIDVQGVDATHVRVAWSLGPGEAPGDLIILDINTATGTTRKGTVVTGAVVFTDGPTLPGDTFSGTAASAGYPPVPDPVVDLQTGRVTKTWEAFFRQANQSITQNTTSINSLPVTPPNPDTVIGTPPSTDNAIARYDGTTGTLIQNSPTIIQDNGALDAFSTTADAVVALHPVDATVAEVWLNAEIDETGAQVALSTAPAYLWQENDGGIIGVGLEIDFNETIGQPVAFAGVMGLAVNAPGSGFGAAGGRIYQTGLGTGAVAGPTLRIDRNDAGSGAASTLSPQRRDGANDFLWNDTGGTLRSGAAAPTENNSVSDTSGIPVANQTFSHSFLLGGM